MSNYLIAGLGNIGPEYEGTRHNIGFDAVDLLMSRHGARPSSERYALRASFSIKGRNLVCIKPTTYMNLSGKAVKYWMDKDGIALDHILVVVDEIALPLSRLRLRPSGSAGGHNGLRSIEECLGTDQYARLRLGVGNDFARGSQVDYVLGSWEETEIPLVRRKVEMAAEVIESFVFAGLERTMNQYNKKVISL